MIMQARMITFLTVFLYAFVAWIVVVFLLSFLINLPRPAFVSLHYVSDLVLFGVVFRSYYEAHPRANPFETTALTMVSLFILEAILFGVIIPDLGHLLNFVDWIFPAFLIATTVYIFGKK